jgi:hypothetical protein
MRRSLAIVVAIAVLLTATRDGWAVTPEKECEAAQLAAIGQRISTKLHCRAWAKLTGIGVPPECLRAADDRFFSLLASMGPDCADAGRLIDLGANADAVMSAATAQIETGSSIPDLSGAWTTRTVLGANPDGAESLICGGPDEPVCPEVFAIIECRSQYRDEGAVLRQDSECRSSADSPTHFDAFRQLGNGPVDHTTGECSFAGTVDVPNAFVAHYKGEGVFSSDGNSMTAITTAGLGGDWIWLAATSGERVSPGSR